MIFILLLVGNLLEFDSIHDFSVWLRIGSNLADINWLKSHTGKAFKNADKVLIGPIVSSYEISDFVVLIYSLFNSTIF